MRHLAFLLVILNSSCCFADCASGHIPESRPEFSSALADRLRVSGWPDLTDAGAHQDFDVLAIPSAHQFIYLRPSIGPIAEVSHIAHAPIVEHDVAFQRMIVSFTLARYASITEAQALGRIVAEETAHLDKGTWAIRIGDAIAVYTRNNDGVVVKFGVCN